MYFPISTWPLLAFTVFLTVFPLLIVTRCQAICPILLNGGEFFDKEYILISQIYQLHPISATTYFPISNTDAHNQIKKKNYNKTKFPLQWYHFLVAAALTPRKKNFDKTKFPLQWSLPCSSSATSFRRYSMLLAPK
jgi:hypothetical protein